MVVLLFRHVKDGAGATRPLPLSTCVLKTQGRSREPGQGPGIVGAGGRDSAWGPGQARGQAGAAGATEKRQKIRRQLPGWYPHPKAGGCLP